MAIHYVGDIIHQKCYTKNGIRRSPMIGASYDADQPLKDAVTKRTIYRRHKDGTVIWDTDIVSADKSCPYGDSSVPSQVRRERMYNDMFHLIKKKTDRFRAVFVVALPNEFTQKQAIACARNMALAFSKRYHRPCDYSIHYKRGNLHIHISMPEWEWEHGKWGTKPKNLYINRHTNEFIHDGIYYDSNGNDIRLPMVEKGNEPIYETDKNGKTVCVNQLRGERNKRRWVRQRTGFLVNPSELSWLNDEVDRHINRSLEKANSNDRVVRYPKEITSKLKSLGLEQKHIGPQSYRTKDDRYQEISEHNKTSKRIENAIVSTLIQKEEVEELSSSVASDTAFIDNATVELAESEKKMETFKNGDNFVESYITNVIQPEYTFISDATEKYFAFLQEKQNALQPLIQLLDSNIDALTKEISAKSKKLKNTPRNNARIKLWNGNIKILKNFTSKLKQYSTKNFVKNIQKIATRRWQKLSPWSKVKYIETHQNAANAFIYAGHMDLDVEDKNYDNVPTPNALDLPNTTKWQKHTNNQNFIENIVTYDADYKPSISTERLSEIVSAESTLTETSYDDNMRIFTDIDVNAPKNMYRAKIASIAEQERIAEQKRIEEAKRLAEQKAEQERIAREKARLEAKEAKRLAELKKQEQLQSTEEDAEFKKKQAIHKKLSNLRQEAQDRAIAELFEIPEAYDEVYDILVIERNKEIDKHTDDPSYILPPPVKKSDVKTIGYQLLLKRSKKFDELCERYEIDISEYKERKNDADTYFEANLAPKQNTEEKEDTSKKKGNLKKQKSNTITRQKTINNTIKTNRS